MHDFTAHDLVFIMTSNSSFQKRSWLPWAGGVVFLATFLVSVTYFNIEKSPAYQCLLSCKIHDDFATANLPKATQDAIRYARALATSYRPLPTITVFPTSFWFVKNVKVGGTTLAGVLRGMCAHYGMACLNPKEGRIGWKREEEIIAAATAAKDVGFEHVTITNHGAYLPEAAEYLGEGSQKPLLFTTLRHPVGRVLSAYFYNLIGEHRSRTGVSEEEGAACIEALRSGETCKLLEGFEEHYVHDDGVFGRNHIFKYISGGKSTAADAFAQYDFVFMTERFDESLVVFMLKYGLELRDIAYLKMKDRNGTYPKENDMPQESVDFIRERNELDLELWDLANSALDAQVSNLNAIGHDVEGAREAFGALQAVVALECADFEAWYEDHGFDTMLTYWGRDNGVGSRCIGHAARLAGFG